MKFKKLSFGIILTVIAGYLISCSYSFTGSSVPPHLKTIAIATVQDRSGSGEPELSNYFTNQLNQRFIDDNSLDVTNKSEADAFLDCTITSLQDDQAIVSSGQQEQTRRITIRAKVIYKDLVKRKTVFNKSFSNSTDYQVTTNITTARKEAIEQTVDVLTEDILLGVVSNW
jgi:outer membrane lipopolysaccharide assembly protein LptE/RlpB